MRTFSGHRHRSNSDMIMFNLKGRLTITSIAGQYGTNEHMEVVVMMGGFGMDVKGRDRKESG